MGNRKGNYSYTDPAMKGVLFNLKIPAWLLERLKKHHGTGLAAYIRTLILEDTGWEPPIR